MGYIVAILILPGNYGHRGFMQNTKYGLNDNQVLISIIKADLRLLKDQREMLNIRKLALVGILRVSSDSGDADGAYPVLEEILSHASIRSLLDSIVREVDQQLILNDRQTRSLEERLQRATSGIVVVGGPPNQVPPTPSTPAA